MPALYHAAGDWGELAWAVKTRCEQEAAVPTGQTAAVIHSDNTFRFKDFIIRVADGAAAT